MGPCKGTQLMSARHRECQLLIQELMTPTPFQCVHLTHFLPCCSRMPLTCRMPNCLQSGNVTTTATTSFRTHLGPETSSCSLGKICRNWRMARTFEKPMVRTERPTNWRKNAAKMFAPLESPFFVIAYNFVQFCAKFAKVQT